MEPMKSVFWKWESATLTLKLYTDFTPYKWDGCKRLQLVIQPTSPMKNGRKSSLWFPRPNPEMVDEDDLPRWIGSLRLPELRTRTWCLTWMQCSDMRYQHYEHEIGAAIMPIDFRRFAPLFLISALSAVKADTLHFVATSDQNGQINYDWQSPNNWYVPLPGGGYTNIYRVPTSDDSAIVRTTANAAANSIGLMTLALLPGITINGGDFSLITLATGAGSSFAGSVLRIQSAWSVTNGCTLTSCKATIDSGAFLFLEPGGGGSMTTLSLVSSTLYNVGQIVLADLSELDFLGGTNELWLRPGAVLSGSGASTVGVNVVGGASLVFYHDGTVRGDPGALTMNMAGTLWTNTLGLSKFHTSATNATIEIHDNFTIPAATTNLFTGQGVTRFFGGASPFSILGWFQVGAVDTATQVKDPGTVELVRGTFAGTGPIYVRDPNSMPSTLIWTEGTLANAEVDIDVGSKLHLTGINAKFASGTTINNSGTATWTTDGGDLNLVNGGAFNNLSGALFDVQNNALIKGGAGGGVLNNAGTFRKSAGAGDTAFYWPPGPGSPATFNNTGLLDVQSGRVILMGGQNSGQFNVAGGAKLAFWSQANVQSAGATFTGAGLVSVGGTFATSLELDTDVTINNLDLESRSVVDGKGNLTIAQSLTYVEGTVQGSGTLNIASTGTGTIYKGASITLSRDVNNSGMVTDAIPVSAGRPVVWNNLPGSVLAFQGPSPSWDFSYNGAPPTLVNSGLVSNAVPLNVLINWAISNSGQVHVSPYGLSLLQGFTQTAGETTVAAGAFLIADHGPMLLLGGTLRGTGTVQGSVANSAIVHPGASPGILTVTGSFTNMPDATLDVEIGGSAPGTGYSRLASPSGQEWLGGALSISFDNGFLPSLGDRFAVVVSTNGTCSGEFASMRGLRPGNGLVLVPVYSPTAVNLAAANDPVLTSPAHTFGSTSFSFLTTAGFTYVAEYTDSLNPVSWMLLGTVVGDGTPKAVNDSSSAASQRYYRVRFQ
jgi:hypothetical protein